MATSSPASSSPPLPHQMTHVRRATYSRAISAASLAKAVGIFLTVRVKDKDEVQITVALLQAHRAPTRTGPSCAA
eukprot:8667979-Pyramimonas_sp.AAC.1